MAMPKRPILEIVQRNIPDSTEEISELICGHLADVVLFEAYPYLSINGLREEYLKMVEEREQREAAAR